MSEDLKLQANENVIKTSSEVGYGGGMFNKRNDLILTNQSIILVKKGLLGKTKEVVRFPLSDIVISNNQAQVKLGKKDLVTPTLDVYFQSGVERFIFTWEEEIKDWVNTVNTLLTGQPDVYKQQGDFGEEFEHVAEALSGAVNKVKKAFGIKSTEAVSCKCPSCGASLTGISGETIKCPYCDSYVTLP